MHNNKKKINQKEEVEAKIFHLEKRKWQSHHVGLAKGEIPDGFHPAWEK